MLIYLNGTSSAGKTSIAHQLQSLIQKPVLYFSIDTLLYSLAAPDLEAIMGKQPYRFDLNWNSLFSGYFSCVDSLINTDNSVIADAPVYNTQLAALYEKYIQPHSNKKVIQVSCPIDILEEREKNRKDRALGIAKRQFSGIRQYLEYDLEIHSNELNPHAAAKQILNE